MLTVHASEQNIALHSFFATKGDVTSRWLSSSHALLDVAGQVLCQARRDSAPERYLNENRQSLTLLFERIALVRQDGAPEHRLGEIRQPCHPA